MQMSQKCSFGKMFFAVVFVNVLMIVLSVFIKERFCLSFVG